MAERDFVHGTRLRVRAAALVPGDPNPRICVIGRFDWTEFNFGPALLLSPLLREVSLSSFRFLSSVRSIAAVQPFAAPVVHRRRNLLGLGT